MKRKLKIVSKIIIFGVNIMIITILATIFVLGVLIFVHEFGHFIIAKLSGIKVERLSLGYPPRAFGFKWGETDYCISWLPLGGYCKMAGIVDESLDTNIKGEPWEFQSKSAPTKAAVISAGSGMNFVLAIFIFSLMAYYLGVLVPGEKPLVGGVRENFPAEKAGIKEGDLIISIDGVKISTWEQMTEIIRSNLSDRPQKVEWLRDGKTYSADIISVMDKIRVDLEMKEVKLIGIENVPEIKKVGIFGAVKDGFGKTYTLTLLIVVTIKRIITGEESIKSSLGGPIIIAKLAGESAKSGMWSLLGFMAFLSLNLGFLNLLPVPVLDGGHLVFIAVEGIIRRPLPLKFKLIIQQIGMALLFLLMAFIIYNDILRVIK